MGDDQLGLPQRPPRARVIPAPRAEPTTVVPRVKPVDRQQLVLRPVVVDALIPEDHPARAIWAFVGRLDLRKYREPIRAVEGAAGRTPFDPHVLVSLWVYSYSRGVSSARAIARLCDDDPAYQWLTGLAGMCGHTLSDFRVAHAEALRDLFAQVLALLSAEGLITLERVMQDGTKVRACAASKHFRRKPRIETLLAEARAVVDALDAQPEAQISRQTSARARAARDRHTRLEAALKEFDTLAAAKSPVTRVSTTDPDARVMRQADHGSAPNYNVQVSTDACHSVIVGIEAVQARSDYQQLTPAVDRLAQAGPRTPDQVVVDGGYISQANIVAMAARGIDLIGPVPSAAAEGTRENSYRPRGVDPAYQAAAFRYDPATDTYRCPQAHTLRYDAQEPHAGGTSYRYKAAAEDCRRCPAKARCCPRTHHGRSIERREPRPEVIAFRAKMQTDEARAIYRTRSQVAEFPNLWLKAKLGLRQFCLRGLAKVQMEALWAAVTYDIQVWLRLRGRPLSLVTRTAA